MAKQIIGIGTTANDGTGDTLRVAMDKINDNFNELYPVAPQAVTFANPLVIDVTTYKDWKCAAVSGSTTVNLTNMSNGEGGIIELIISGAGGYTITMGSMFTKNSGGGTIDATAAADNIIAWMVSGSDIIYSISQIS